MAEYRCYCLGSDDHIRAVNFLECDDDDTARVHAGQLLRTCGHHAVELWQGDRKVGQVRTSRPGGPAEASGRKTGIAAG